MQEDDGDTGDSIGVELARSQPAKSVCPNTLNSAPAQGGGTCSHLSHQSPCWPLGDAWPLIRWCFCHRFLQTPLRLYLPPPHLRITMRKRCPWARARPPSTSPPAVSPAPGRIPPAPQPNRQSQTLLVKEATRTALHPLISRPIPPCCFAPGCLLLGGEGAVSRGDSLGACVRLQQVDIALPDCRLTHSPGHPLLPLQTAPAPPTLSWMATMRTQTATTPSPG